MRKLKIYNYLSLLLIAVMVQSCETMTDNYQQYIKDGETIYLAKADSVTSNPGNNRVLINCILKNAYNVNKVWVYWNDRHDSTSFDYAQTADIDTLKMMITGLEEKSYIFDIYTKNIDGNSSIKVTTFASSYGERYRLTLNPKVVSGFSCDTVNATMSWLSSDETELQTQVRYTNISGIEKTLTLITDSLKIKLEEFSDLGTISYRSYYKPEVACIDSFATNWTSYQLPQGYLIYKTVAVTPKTGGATVEWGNPENIVIAVRVQYLSNTGVMSTKVFKTSPASITGLNTTTRDFKVTVSDISANIFGPKIFRVTPL